MAKKKIDDQILDVNAAMQGSLIFSDPVNLRINGKFEGTLTTKGKLIIGQSAEVKADIIAESLIISGNVRGKIKATENLSLTSTAQVYGEITVPKIAIEEGAIFIGRCNMPEGKITLEELSEYLSIEESKIAEWVDNGKIPVEREGDKLLFDFKEVETWISTRT